MLRGRGGGQEEEEEEGCLDMEEEGRRVMHQ